MKFNIVLGRVGFATRPDGRRDSNKTLLHQMLGWNGRIGLSAAWS